MTKDQKQLYQSADALREILRETLAGQKYKLDCGHHFTGIAALGADITIRNSAKEFKCVCSLCGYCGY